MRNNNGEVPTTSSQAPAAGNTSCEATNPPGAPIEAEPAYKPADKHAKGVCLACGKQFHVPESLRRRKAHRGWPPQVRCRPCKLANDAHYTAREKTAPATTVASDTKVRAASLAALVTSDGETPKRNWLLAAKGLLSANVQRVTSWQQRSQNQQPYHSGCVSEVRRSWSPCTSPVFPH